MDEDGNRIAGRAIGTRRQKRGACLPSNVADSVVRNTTPSVAVPGSGTEPASRRDDVDDRHCQIGAAIRKCTCGDRAALAIRCCRRLNLAELTHVQRDAEDLRLQGDRGKLAHDWTGVSAIAEGDSGLFTATRDRDTEWNGEKKQKR